MLDNLYLSVKEAIYAQNQWVCDTERVIFILAKVCTGDNCGRQRVWVCGSWRFVQANFNRHSYNIRTSVVVLFNSLWPSHAYMSQ